MENKLVPIWATEKEKECIMNAINRREEEKRAEEVAYLKETFSKHAQNGGKLTDVQRKFLHGEISYTDYFHFTF